MFDLGGNSKSGTNEKPTGKRSFAFACQFGTAAAQLEKGYVRR